MRGLLSNDEAPIYSLAKTSNIKDVHISYCYYATLYNREISELSTATWD